MRVLALIAGLLVLSACATEGSYHANTAGVSDGYSETRLDETHWAVEFIGDPSASQETVESYLLYRAAELTVANGYDWFIPASQTLDSESEVVVTGARRVDSPVWRPLWRHRNRTQWSDWMVRGASPSQPTQQTVQTVDRMAAREEISVGRGAPPAGAFNAREVMASLEPSIVRP
jgi:hypothetical protein